MVVAGDEERAKRFPAKVALEQPGGIRRKIGVKFALDAGLGKVGAGDRHGAPVDFDEKVSPRAGLQVDGEGDVGDKSDLMAQAEMRNIDPKGEGIAPNRAGGRRQVGRNVLGVGVAITQTFGGELRRDFEVGDFQLVFDEGAAGFPVFARPIDLLELRLAMLTQEPRSPIGERIDHWGGALGRIVVELGARPIDISGMKEMAEPIVCPVDRSSHKIGDMGRAQEPVSPDVPDDGDIIFGHSEGGRVGRPAETRPARFLCDDRALAHGLIVAVA